MQTQFADVDNGRTVRVRRGLELFLILTENPTTGYRWEISVTGEAVTILDSTFEPGAGSVGGGGARRTRLIALHEGSSTVHARLHRAWEPDAIRAYSLTITVDGD